MFTFFFFDIFNLNSPIRLYLLFVSVGIYCTSMLMKMFPWVLGSSGSK